MKYALVIIEIPEETWRKDTSLPVNIANQVLNNEQYKGSTEMLSPSCFLCPLEEGLSDLTTIVATVKARGLKTRTLFFDQDPSWIIS